MPNSRKALCVMANAFGALLLNHHSWIRVTVHGVIAEHRVYSSLNTVADSDDGFLSNAEIPGPLLVLQFESTAVGSGGTPTCFYQAH